MIKLITFIVAFCAASYAATASADGEIWLPNIPGFATGTTSGGKNGLDVNINSGTITATNPSVGATGSSVPANATFVGAKNGSGNLVGLLTGQQTMANSLACVLPSDQSAIPITVSGTLPIAIVSPIPAGSNVIGAVTQSGTWTAGRTWTLSSGTDSVTVSGSVTTAGGLVSTNNSSSTPLGSSGVFTGTADDVTNYAAATITLATDQSGSLSYQWSANGTNWDNQDTYTVTVSSPGTTQSFTVSVLVEARYFRIVYTNGGTAQGSFRLQSVYKVSNQTGDINYLGSVPTDSNNAVDTKSIIYGKITTGGGNYVAVKVNPSGALSTSIGDISGVVGQNTMANSLPVAIASNQSVIPVVVASPLPAGTNSIGGVTLSSSLPSGTNSIGSVVQGSAAATASAWPVKPTDGTNVITVKAASTAPVATDTAEVVAISPNTPAIATKQPVNANGSLSSRQTVTSSESSVVAPANAVGVIVECESVNVDNLRWGFSSSSSAILSSTLGMLCEPGRDTGVLPFGAGTYVHLISTGAGSDYADIQWVLSQ